MIKKCSFLAVASICCAIAVFLHAEEVVVNKKMAAALKEFNPQFVPWRIQDYSPTIQKDAAEGNRRPYALELDVNGDEESDLILDGHDDQKNILLCLLSNPTGYDVIVIRKYDLMDPTKLENWNDGVKENGLNYYLWPHKEEMGITLAYPQESDSEGNILNDGAMIDYIFEDGRFIESHQPL